MACARRTKDDITTSVWRSGSMAKISTISRTKVYKPASRASLARNEEQAASVRYAGIHISQEAEGGRGGTVGARGIVTGKVGGVSAGWPSTKQRTCRVASP